MRELSYEQLREDYPVLARAVERLVAPDSTHPSLQEDITERVVVFMERSTFVVLDALSGLRYRSVSPFHDLILAGNITVLSVIHG